MVNKLYVHPLTIRRGTVGTRSRAIRGSTSDDRVACSSFDGRCAPARPALHVLVVVLVLDLFARERYQSGLVLGSKSIESVMGFADGLFLSLPLEIRGILRQTDY